MKSGSRSDLPPGPRSEEWRPGFLGIGFDPFSLNFHMSLGRDRILEHALAGKTRRACWKEDRSASARLDFYCTPSPVSGTPGRIAGAGYISDARKIPELIM